MYPSYCKKNSRSYTLNLFKEIDFQNRPFFSKLKKNHNSKVSEIHERNFRVCVVIIGGICVPKINNLADKLYKLEISPIAPLKIV